LSGSRHLILGVSASIAIHRALDLASRFKKRGDRVSVVMTPDAVKLVAPVTFQAISLSKVFCDMWELTDGFDHDHIRMAQTGDLLLVAPASASTIGKLAHGFGDNVLLTTALAFQGPKLFAPAMNWRMWSNPIVRENVERLDRFGWTRIGPADGDLACGESGPGRLADVDDIVRAVDQALAAR
jgi:phosphopantothenoylcysteine decarboxylase / phosphopantothenate---cysteine ligase